MKKSLLLIAALTLAAVMPLQAQRYLTEIFSSVTVTSNVQYGVNITVITGAPTADTLVMDVYEPMNDTLTARPLIIIAHTGSFLPIYLNGQCTGDKSDYTVQQVAEGFARRGYVVAAINYRLGWLPLSTDQETRTGSLLRAAYRGIQDMRTAVRYFHADAAGSNTYRVNTNKIVAGGFGTGGYIALGAGYLDSYDEINLPKFLTSGGQSFVDTAMQGDVEGKWNRPLNLGNHTAYSSDVHFVFNAGGAVGDSTWMEAGEPGVAALHVPSDPFAPYTSGAVIVPTTQEFVVNVSGSRDIVRRADRIGLNAALNSGTYNSSVDNAAHQVNEGLEGLFPYYLPGPQAGPWDYWDTTTCPHNAAGAQTNPDMSMAKADNYIDSTLKFLSRRIACGLSLAACTQVSTPEQLAQGAVSIYPNPSNGTLNIRSEVTATPIQSIEVMDLSGRVVQRVNAINRMEYRLDHSDLPHGMYIVKATTSKGAIAKKVVMQ